MNIHLRPKQDENQQLLKTKRLKTKNIEKADHIPIKAPDNLTIDDDNRPKSRKELRVEKKALRKAAATITTEPIIPSTFVEVSSEEKHRQRKERRKEFLREKDLILQKQKREDKKLRQKKKINRLANSSKQQREKQNQQKKRIIDPDDLQNDSRSVSKKSKKKKSSVQEHDVAMDVFNKVFYEGSSDNKSGITTLRLGVKYKDLVVGTGKMLQDGSLITVKYELTSGKLVTPIDSSNNFTFVVGKGEVIQGWDIGLVGMRVGGRRKLTVPPKAGYGAKDIGGGCGAELFFDITLLSC